MDGIALEAKAHWGYARDQMAAWSDELRTKPETIACWPTFVAEIDDEVIGFAQIDPTVEPWELVSLWVLPRYMRQGVGTGLLGKVRALAQVAGEEAIHIDSDPHALGFYRACGASVVGSVAAPIEGEAGRVRPQLRMPTREA